MLVKDVTRCAQITANDATRLREIFHPARDAVDLGYSLAYATLGPGERSLPHRLDSSEVYYVLYGAGIMHQNESARTVHSGHAIHIPPKTVQWIENTENMDLAFLCIVDPPWRHDDEEILE